jgi:hypothetical protein
MTDRTGRRSFALALLLLSEEQLIIYLPRHKLLYEADFFTSGFAGDLPRVTEDAVFLAGKIKELGLDVEKIVGTHGRLRTIEELHEAIERRNRATTK